MLKSTQKRSSHFYPGGPGTVDQVQIAGRNLGAAANQDAIKDGHLVANNLGAPTSGVAVGLKETGSSIAVGNQSAIKEGTGTARPRGAGVTAQRRLLLAMSGSVAMVNLDQTVVGVVLPTLGTDLGLRQNALEWVVTAYLLAYASLVQVGGYLGDRFGQRRAFFTGVVLFTLASLLAGLAPTAETLLLGRALQGVGAALMQPASLALAVAAFPAETRGRAMSLYYGVACVALVLGPPLGGVVAQYAGWRWIFLLNLPVAAVTLALALAWCPPDRARDDKKAAPDFDFKGAAVLVAGLTFLVLALQEGPVWGWSSTPTLVVGLLGVGLLGLLVRLEMVASDPVLDLRLLYDRVFRGDLVAMVAVRFALVATTVFLAFWLQNSAGLSASCAGLVLLGLVLSIVAATLYGGRLLDRHGPRWVNSGGLLAMGLGHALVVPGLLAVSAVGVIPGLLVIGVGAGLAGSANTDALTRAGPAARGRAAALTQTMRQVGGAVGVPLIGVVVLLGPELTNVYGLLALLLVAGAGLVAVLQR